MAVVALVLSMAGLHGCGGGADVEALPETSAPPVSDYTGPPPATAEVQSFKINVWDNLKAGNRCGGCHIDGGQSPTFVRQDDVNLAYAEANAIVDLFSPPDSRMVTKVAGGHNCWLGSDAACGDILTTWIDNWAGDAVAGGGTTIDLEAPTIKDVGTSKSFPADSALFAATVYPVVTTYCADCHNSGAQFPQSPYFAEGDVDAAYDAARSKIDLDQTDDSRLVVRLADEFHNCWEDCPADAAEMLAAVDAFADQIPLTEVDPSLVISKALTLYDGVVASGGDRYDNNVIAMYEFKTGTGNVAYDTSGVEPSLNLTLSGDVEWVGGWGIRVADGKAQGSTAASRKLHDLIKATGEYSIEAWAVPANVTQEDARIVSYSAGTTARNFTLGQTLYNYDFLNRSSVTNGDGQPGLSTADDDEDLQATQQHVVVTFDPINGRNIYVNGTHTDDLDEEGGGTLNDWDDTFALVLGNEVSSDRLWQGTLRLVAIHNRALTPEQITQNFEAGVGEKFFLLFSVGDLVNVPDSYVMFEVSQFDSYSYLFNTPTFISLDASADPDDIPVMGMRIGINGTEAAVGQTWRTLDTMVTREDYGSSGQVLSDRGTIIGLEKGPEGDEFFLSFERLGANENVVTEPVPLAPADPPDGEPQPVVGLKTFDEINATMAKVTGISANQTDVRATYDIIRQQLPVVENIGGFLSAHQVAVAQLSIEYCNALVNDTSARASYFPGFDFGASAQAAFDTVAERDAALDPLIDNMLGTGLTSQPDPADVRSELDSLVDILTSCGGSCAADRTETTVKAACAAVLGSAAVLLQ